MERSGGDPVRRRLPAHSQSSFRLPALPEPPAGRGRRTDLLPGPGPAFPPLPHQIRKDLAQFGEFGIRGVGYRVDELEQRLRALLGLDVCRGMILIGVGNLGRALIHHPGFNSTSFRLVGAVDSDPGKIGHQVGDLTVEAPGGLRRLVQRTGADIGILAVPAEAAPTNYEALVAAGIRAILNFAPARLPGRPGILTRHVDLRISLEELGYYLRRQDDARR